MLLLRYISVRLLVLVLSSGTSSLAPVNQAVAAEPVFAALPERVVVAPGHALQLNLDAADEDGDDVLVTVEGAPPWMRAVHGVTTRNAVVSTQMPAHWNYVEDMEIDADGNLYFIVDSIETQVSAIVRIDRHGTHRVLKSGLWNPGQLAVAPDRTVYYTEEYGPFTQDPWVTKIYRLNADGSGTLIDDSVDRLYDMDADSSGNLILLRVNMWGTITQLLKLNPRDGVVSLLAGSSTEQTMRSPDLHKQVMRDGAGESAQFIYSHAQFVGENDMTFVHDLTGNVRKVTPQGDVSTLPFTISPMTREIMADADGRAFLLHDSGILGLDASGSQLVVAGSLGEPGNRDGNGVDARFRTIVASVMRNDGTLVVADVLTDQQPWRVMLREVRFDTHRLSGTPAESDHGEWKITVVASDGANSVRRTVTVAVSNQLDLKGATRVNATLPAGVEVFNGVLAGAISGDAAAPAHLRSATIQAGSTLRNVTIGAGVQFGAGTTLLGNVRFDSSAYVPPGVLLDAAYGYLPDTGSADGGYPGSVDLNGSILSNGTTLLDEIRATSPAFAQPGALTFHADGRLVYTRGDTRLTFEVIRVMSGDAWPPTSTYRSGVFFDSTATRHINTPSGRIVYLRPSSEDDFALAYSLLPMNLSLSRDLFGVRMIGTGYFADRKLRWAVLPDPMSQPAAPGLQPGFHRRAHPAFAGYSHFVHVFADDGSLREQAFYPTALAPGLLDVFLNPNRDGDVVVLPTGEVELKFGTAYLRLMPGPELKPATAATGFRAAGDLDGDGRVDYRMTYPSPLSVEQVYYALPE